ncbi:MAG: DsrE family protein [ANME-2 cluster archaeon]|nr:DsrE family protein [ANME-2 cluster archaeon]
MSKKVNIIVTQPPYGKEEVFGAIPLAATQAAADNEASITFVSGAVHAVVTGQQTGYGDVARWGKNIPPLENEIKNNLELYDFYVLEQDLTKRGIKDSEIIEGIKKTNISELTDRILESEVTLVL